MRSRGSARLTALAALAALASYLCACTPSTPAPVAPAMAAETGPDDHGPRPSQPRTVGAIATGTGGAVASAEANASRIGVEILQRGGNAVDAAIAVGFALGVTHPSAGNIGGGGFMVIRLPDGTSTTIDYREMAPGKASRDMYLDAQGEVSGDSRLGPRAAGIPGVVAGFALAHASYGKLPWKDVVAPAVALARDGWALDAFHVGDLDEGATRMIEYAEALERAGAAPALRAAVATTVATFRHPDGRAYVEGEVWKQPALAATLQAIADRGANAFYRGPLATTMAREVAAMGGLWTADDLAAYRAAVRAPLVFGYRGHQVITMPPPSAGGVVLRQILGASEILGLAKLDWDSVDRIHLYVEALRRIYADRNLLIGDPDFVEIPLATLLDVGYLKTRLADIRPDRATPSSEVGAGVELGEKPQTTHFSVVDREQMAVANTFTLNGGFGAKVQIPGTGVTLNNEMDDFTAKVGAPNMFGLVQGPQNAIAPGKRMLSSMTPTILVKDGKLRAVVGSPGGPTITTTVAQLIMQLVDHGRDLEAAIAAPRVHHQWLPDMIWHEPELAAELVEALKLRGHALGSRGRIGHANCIEVTASGELHAIADVDRDGGAAAAF
jgi:gamma-glutamyltranspeptidase/glutathione hydrolase